MVSSWLSKASALAVCAIAVSRAVATPTGAPAPAEEVKFDNLGQMHWDSDNSKTEPAPIGRPNFDRLDVAAIEKSFEAETKLWLQEAMQTGKHAAGDLNEKLQELLSNIEKTVDGVKHDAAASAQDWIHKGLVWVNGVKCESKLRRILHLSTHITLHRREAHSPTIPRLRTASFDVVGHFDKV